MTVCRMLFVSLIGMIWWIPFSHAQMPGEVKGPKPKKKDIDLTKETPFKHAPHDTEYQLISEQIVSNDTIMLNEYLSDVPVQIDANTGVYVKQGYVTNKEYREFIRYVRDSLFRITLAECRYCTDLSLMDGNMINWDTKVNFNHYLPDLHRYYDGYYYPNPKLKTKYLHFVYPDSTEKSAYLYYNHAIFKPNIYPDTLVWLRGGGMSEGQVIPLLEYYNTHPLFDDYPVVGLQPNQVSAYLYWKGKLHNQYLRKKNAHYEVRYQLPSVAFADPHINKDLQKKEWVITGKDYLHFMEHCRDSMVRTRLCEDVNEEYCILPDFCVEDYPLILNWYPAIDWDDPNVKEALDYKNNHISDSKELLKFRFKPGYYKHTYTTYCLLNRQRYSLELDKRTIPLFPDTAQWRSTYGTKFIGESDQHHQPMVGITYSQAVAFYYWKIRTLKSENQTFTDFLIPTETQWNAVMQGKPLPEDESNFEIPGPFFRYQIVVVRRADPSNIPE